jgi:hypothetical protein
VSNAATVTVTVEGRANLRRAVNDSFTVESGVTLDVTASEGLVSTASEGPVSGSGLWLTTPIEGAR